MLNFVFLRTSLLTTSFDFFKFVGTVFSLPITKSSTFLFKSFKLVGTNLVISSLSTSAFKAKNIFLAGKSDLSTPVAHYNSLLIV